MDQNHFFKGDIEAGDVFLLARLEEDGSGLFILIKESPYSNVFLTRDEMRMGMLDVYKPEEYWSDINTDEPPFPLDSNFEGLAAYIDNMVASDE